MPALPIPGWLHTEVHSNVPGLYDENRSKFVPRGCNVGAVNLTDGSGGRDNLSDWGSTTALARAAIAQSLAGGGVNFVRMVLHWNVLESQAPVRLTAAECTAAGLPTGSLGHSFDANAPARAQVATDVDDLNSIVANVQAFAAVGIRCMLDLHTKYYTTTGKSNDTSPSWLYGGVTDKASLFFTNSFASTHDLSSALGNKPTTSDYPSIGLLNSATGWGPMDLALELHRLVTKALISHDNFVAVDFANEPTPGQDYQLATGQTQHYKDWVKTGMGRVWRVNPRIICSYEQCIGARYLSGDGATHDYPGLPGSNRSNSSHTKIYYVAADMPTDMHPQDYGATQYGTSGFYQGGKMFQYHTYPNGEPPSGGNTFNDSTFDTHSYGVIDNYGLAKAAGDPLLIGEFDAFTGTFNNVTNQQNTPLRVNGSANPTFPTTGTHRTTAQLVGGRGRINAGTDPDQWNTSLPAIGGLFDWMATNSVGFTFWAGLPGGGGSVTVPAGTGIGLDDNAKYSGSGATGAYPGPCFKTAATSLQPVDAWFTFFANATSGGGASITAGTPSIAVSPSGPAIVGALLAASANASTWIPTSGLTFTYQWKRAGTNISGATASSYTLVSADLGQSITCRVTGTDTSSNTANATSNAITPTANAPSIVTPPQISGSTAVGGNIILHYIGSWSGSPTVYSAQWQRDGVSVGSPVTPAVTWPYAVYPTTSADDGHTITAVITASNSNGTGNATSNGKTVATAPSGANPLGPQVFETGDLPLATTFGTASTALTPWGGPINPNGAKALTFVQAMVKVTTVGTATDQGSIAVYSYSYTGASAFTATQLWVSSPFSLAATGFVTVAIPTPAVTDFSANRYFILVALTSTAAKISAFNKGTKAGYFKFVDTQSLTSVSAWPATFTNTATSARNFLPYVALYTATGVYYF